MKERTVRLLVGVAAVLILAYAVVALVGRGGGETEDAGASAITAELAAVTAEEFSRARILSPTDTLEFVKVDDRWTVNGMPASTSAMDRLVDALSEARVGHLISSNPSNHQRLGVAEPDAYILEVQASDGSTRRLILGNPGPGPITSYVRLEDSDEVYVLHGDLGTIARRQPSTWRDRGIIRVDTAAVREVAVTRDGASYTVLRGDDGWTVNGQPVDSTAIRDMLVELATLEGQGFVESEDSESSTTIAREVVARNAGGEVLAHVRIWPGEEDWLMIADAEGPAAVQPGWRLELATWRADRLAPEREKLLGSPE